MLKVINLILEITMFMAVIIWSAIQNYFFAFMAFVILFSFVMAVEISSFIYFQKNKRGDKNDN